MNVQMLCWEEVLTGERSLRVLQTEASQEENEKGGGGPGTLEDRPHPLHSSSPQAAARKLQRWARRPTWGAIQDPRLRIPDSQASVKGCRARQEAAPGGSSFLANGRTNRNRGRRAVKPPPDSAKVSPALPSRVPPWRTGFREDLLQRSPSGARGGSAWEGFPAQITLLAVTERS